mmetsp:Transcript_464/g.768  ORF Transcript_464/g.768 Transcript_464/m.768 type:complete len:825 (-) Transcript_464:105-2579(-)
MVPSSLPPGGLSRPPQGSPSGSSNRGPQVPNRPPMSAPYGHSQMQRPGGHRGRGHGHGHSHSRGHPSQQQQASHSLGMGVGGGSRHPQNPHPSVGGSSSHPPGPGPGPGPPSSYPPMQSQSSVNGDRSLPSAPPGGPPSGQQGPQGGPGPGSAPNGHNSHGVHGHNQHSSHGPGQSPYHHPLHSPPGSRQPPSGPHTHGPPPHHHQQIPSQHHGHHPHHPHMHPPHPSHPPSMHPPPQHHGHMPHHYQHPHPHYPQQHHAPQIMPTHHGNGTGNGSGNGNGNNGNVNNTGNGNGNGNVSGNSGSAGSGGVSSGDPREENIFTNTSTATSLNRVGTTSYYEIVLLIVALLYHVSLGKLSPLAIYIDSLLQAPTDSMPYLWSEEQWKDGMGFGGSGNGHGHGSDNSNSFAYSSSNNGIEVIKLVRGIQKDIREMYDDVMLVLVRDYPEIFGKPPGAGTNTSTGAGTSDSSSEWAFSYNKFEWAFAMVNSRHWHLPLEDLDEVMVDLKRFKEVPDPAAAKAGNYGKYGSGTSSGGKEHNLDDTTTASTVDAVNDMPASQPTDQYVSSHDEATKMEHIEEYVNPTSASSPSSPAPAYSRSSSSSSSQSDNRKIVTKHSFMAPLADMLNFGPPCTRGQYNPTTQAFEVVATCSFLAGQEVTFWYSDDCDDVILANYGFTHPMVPRCPTIEDWKYRSHMWKEYAESMEKKLSDAYEDLYELLEESKGCDCTGSSSDSISSSGSGDKRNGTNSNGNLNRDRERYQSNLKGDNHRDDHKRGNTNENNYEKGQEQGKIKPVGTENSSSSSSKRIRKVKRRNVNAAKERDEIGL